MGLEKFKKPELYNFEVEDSTFVIDLPTRWNKQYTRAWQSFIAERSTSDNETKQLVDNIRRNIVTCLKLEGWETEDIEVLIRNAKYARVYPKTRTNDFESLFLDMPRLSDAYVENISMDALENHFHGLVVPEPEPGYQPKQQEIELSLRDIYGSWKK